MGVSTISGSMRFREPDVPDDMEKMCEKGEKKMKILKPGKVPDKRKKFICKTCKCIFECDKYEYEYKCHYDLKDGGCYQATCPTCGDAVYIRG